MEQSSNITAIYCRTAAPDSTAIEAQREALLRYAEDHGFGNAQVFEDDGSSGLTLARPAFERMNALISEGRVARVLAQNISRLGRNTAEVLAWAHMAQEHGVVVSTLDMSADTLTAQFDVWASMSELAAIADQKFDPSDRFAAWLAGTHTEFLVFQESGSRYTMFRIPKNSDFDYLYFQRNYNGHSVVRGGKFEYAGLYCKADGLVYDAQYEMETLVGKQGRQERGAKLLLEALQCEVRGAVEAVIANDRRNLKVTALDKRRGAQLVQFKEYEVADGARRAYMKNKDGSFPLRCAYIPSPWSEDSFLEYIRDPAGYVQSEAATYISGHQEDLLMEFLQNDALRVAYSTLMKDTQSRVHYIKRIFYAVTSTDAKTVRVTIRKNSTEFTFKTDADTLRCDCGNSYYTHRIVAADRREFERLFGRNADYYPEEIVRIEFGRAVLYEGGAKQ